MNTCYHLVLQYISSLEVQEWYIRGSVLIFNRNKFCEASLTTLNELPDGKLEVYYPTLYKAIVSGLTEGDFNQKFRLAHVIQLMGSVAATTEVVDLLLNCMIKEDVTKSIVHEARDGRSYSVHSQSEKECFEKFKSMNKVVFEALLSLNILVPQLVQSIIEVNGARYLDPEQFLRFIVKYGERLNSPNIVLLFEKLVDGRFIYRNVEYDIDLLARAFQKLGNTVLTTKVLLRLIDGIQCNDNSTEVKELLTNLLKRSGILEKTLENLQSEAFRHEFLETIEAKLASSTSLEWYLILIKYLGRDNVLRTSTITIIVDKLLQVESFEAGHSYESDYWPVDIVAMLGELLALPELISYLGNFFRRSSNFSWSRGYVLGDIIGCLSPSIVNDQFLRDIAKGLEFDDSQFQTLYTIEKLGPLAAHPDILNGLTSCLHNENEYLRLEAVNTIDTIGDLALTPVITQGITRGLSDEDPYVRNAILAVIRRFSNVFLSADLLKSMLGVLNEVDGDADCTILLTIRWLDKTVIVPQLREELTQTNHVEQLLVDTANLAEQVFNAKSEVDSYLSQVSRIVEVPKLTEQLSLVWMIDAFGSKVLTEEASAKICDSLLADNGLPRQLMFELVVSLRDQQATAIIKSTFLDIIISNLSHEDEAIRYFIVDLIVELGEDVMADSLQDAITKVLQRENDDAQDAMIAIVEAIDPCVFNFNLISTLSDMVSRLDESDLTNKLLKIIIQSEHASMVPDVWDKLAAACDEGWELVDVHSLTKLGSVAEDPAFLSGVSRGLLSGEDSKRNKMLELIKFLGVKAAKPDFLSELLAAIFSDIQEVRSVAARTFIRFNKSLYSEDLIREINNKIINEINNGATCLSDEALSVVKHIGVSAKTPELINHVVTYLQECRELDYVIKLLIALKTGSLVERIVSAVNVGLFHGDKVVQNLMLKAARYIGYIFIENSDDFTTLKVHMPFMMLSAIFSKESKKKARYWVVSYDGHTLCFLDTVSDKSFLYIRDECDIDKCFQFYNRHFINKGIRWVQVLYHRDSIQPLQEDDQAATRAPSLTSGSAGTFYEAKEEAPQSSEDQSTAVSGAEMSHLNGAGF